MNSDRKGSVAVLVLIVLIIFLVAGGIWYYYSLYPSTASQSQTGSSLEDSDISSLVNFLKANNIQGAVVEKIFPSNNGSVYFVKSNGSKNFIYSENLGTTPDDPFPVQNYDILINAGGVGNAVLPDQTEIKSSGKIYDLSSYITGHSVNSSLDNSADGVLSSGMASLGADGLSPNGKYLMNYASQLQHNTTTIQLNSVNINGSFAPLVQFPGTFSFLSWSIDSGYVLMMENPSYPQKGLEVYDIKNATTTHLDVDSSLPHSYLSSNNGLSFIYPSTLVLGTGGGGTAYLDLSDASQTLIGLLSHNVKLMGFIP